MTCRFIVPYLLDYEMPHIESAQGRDSVNIDLLLNK